MTYSNNWFFFDIFTKNCFFQFSLKVDSIYTALASENKFLWIHSSSTDTKRKCHDTVAQDLPAMVSAMDYGDQTVRTILSSLADHFLPLSFVREIFAFIRLYTILWFRKVCKFRFLTIFQKFFEWSRGRFLDESFFFIFFFIKNLLALLP